MSETPSTITEVTPVDAKSRVAVGAVLIDVREPGEWAQGSPVGALRVPLAGVADYVAREMPNPDTPLVLICAGGKRSMAAAQRLQAMGYTQLCSVTEGFTRWKREGLPFEIVSALDAEARSRYSRHLLLPQVGEAGQLRLMRARVLMIGAGGLGSPAAMYLAAAGVGHLRLVDHDHVDLSNLQRQILHTTADVGEAKTQSAATRLRALNPRVALELVNERVIAANAMALLEGVDVVIDGSDNFATRYLLNEACTRRGVPLVYGAVHRFEGQVSVFWPARPGAPGPCYRCLFPEPPPPEAAPNCAEAGVLGVLPGLIGTLQATEALKLLLGIGEPLIGRLLHFDALTMHPREVRLPRDPECPGCGPGSGQGPLTDWEQVCAAR